MKRVRRYAYQINLFWVPRGTPRYPRGDFDAKMVNIADFDKSANANSRDIMSPKSFNLGPNLAFFVPISPSWVPIWLFRAPTWPSWTQQ